MATLRYPPITIFLLCSISVSVCQFIHGSSDDVSCAGMCQRTIECPANAACLPVLDRKDCGVCVCTFGFRPNGGDCETDSEGEQTAVKLVVYFAEMKHRWSAVELSPSQSTRNTLIEQQQVNVLWSCKRTNPKCERALRSNTNQTTDDQAALTLQTQTVDSECTDSVLFAAPTYCSNMAGSDRLCGGGGECRRINGTLAYCFCPYDRLTLSCQGVKPNKCAETQNRLPREMVNRKRFLHKKDPHTAMIIARHLVPNWEHCMRLCEWTGFQRLRKVCSQTHVIIEFVCDKLPCSEGNVSLVEMSNISITDEVRIPAPEDINGTCEDYWRNTMFPERHLVLQLGYGTVYAVIFLLGFAGNFATVFITCRNTSLHNVQNFFILNLSTAALFVCFFSLPFSAIQFLFKRWFFGEFMCRVIPWAQASTLFVSTCSLCAIAIDRYQLIFYSQLKDRLFNSRRAFQTIGGIWLVSTGIPIPYALTMQVQTYDGICGEFCQETWTNMAVKNAFTFTVLTMQFLLPGCIIMFCYVSIFRELNRRVREKVNRIRKHRTQTMIIMATAAAKQQGGANCMPDFGPPNGRKTSSSSSAGTSSLNGSGSVKLLTQDTMRNLNAIRTQRRHKRRNSRILIIQVFIFLLTKLPQNLMAVYMDLNSQQDSFFDPFVVNKGTSNEQTFMYVVTMTMHIISMVSIVLNPVVYALINQAFRDTLIATCRQMAVDLCWCFMHSEQKILTTSDEGNDKKIKGRRHESMRLPVVEIQDDDGNKMRTNEELPFTEDDARSYMQQLTSDMRRFTKRGDTDGAVNGMRFLIPAELHHPQQQQSNNSKNLGLPHIKRKNTSDHGRNRRQSVDQQCCSGTGREQYLLMTESNGAAEIEAIEIFV